MLATTFALLVGCAVTPPPGRCGDEDAPSLAKCDGGGDTGGDSGGDTGGDSGEDTSGDTAADADVLSPIDWPAGCDDRPATPARDGLLVAWTWHGGGYAGFEGVRVVEDAATWDAMLAAWEGAEPAADVDFATQRVVAVAHGESSTCGAGIEDHGAWTGASGPFVWVRFYDSSGACDEACDIAFESVVAYAVPRDADPTACVESHDTCE